MAQKLDARIGQALRARSCHSRASSRASPRKRRLDERRQRTLTRYYIAAGAGGLAVGVHSTEFAIRDPRVGLFEAGPETGSGGDGPGGQKPVLSP